MLCVELNGVLIIVIKDGDGVIYVIGDICIYGDILLFEGFVEGDMVECWVYGLVFFLIIGKF